MTNRINQSIRVDLSSNARFVGQNRESIIYLKFHKFVLETKERFLLLLNRLIDRFYLFLRSVDWVKVRADLFLYLTEAFFEGLVVNYVVAVLFGWQMNPFTVLAYGLFVNKSLEYVRRLRGHGTTETVLKKHE